MEIFITQKKKSFLAKRENFHYFLINRGSHYQYTLLRKILSYCDCAIIRQETKNIGSVFFCVLPFDYILDKTILTDKLSVSTYTFSQIMLAQLKNYLKALHRD